MNFQLVFHAPRNLLRTAREGGIPGILPASHPENLDVMLVSVFTVGSQRNRHGT